MFIGGELNIGASAEDVWALLARRFDAIADWARAIEESRPDPDAPAVAGVPVAGRVCRSRIPGFAEVRERIISYDERAMELGYQLVDPPRLLAAARSRWQVTPIDEHRSRVRWEGRVEPRGLLGHLVAPPVRAGLRWLAARTAEDLRHHLEPRGAEGTKTLEFSRAVDAAPDVAWHVVSDLAGFGDVAPNLSRAEILEGRGEGVVRRCYDARGRGWDEVCELWEDGRRYEMRVRTDTYPFPLRQMFREFRGAWEVEPAGGGTTVSMRYDVEPSALGRALWRPIRRTFARQCELLLDNWQRAIEARAASEAVKAA